MVWAMPTTLVLDINALGGAQLPELECIKLIHAYSPPPGLPVTSSCSLYSLDELDRWCNGIKCSPSLGNAALIMMRFLRSAQDPLLSSEAKSGLVKVVSLIKAASDGKQLDCSTIAPFADLLSCQPVCCGPPYEVG